MEVDEQDWFSTPFVQHNVTATREDQDLLASSPPRETEDTHSETPPISGTSGTTPASTPPQTPISPKHDLPEPILSSSNDAGGSNRYEDLTREKPEHGKVNGPTVVDQSGEDRDADGDTTQKQAGRKRSKRDTRHEPTRESKKKRMSAQVESERSPSDPDRSTVIPINASKIKLSKMERKRRKIGYVCAATNNTPPPSPPKRNPALNLVAGCSTDVRFPTTSMFETL